MPRAIRLDASDLSVFDAAAEPGEWAVPGSFSFLAGGPAALLGRRRAAFANGFLGTGSFGWSTLVAVEEASATDIEQVTRALAAHFVTAHGAPSETAARDVASREIAFAASLCAHPPGTIITLNRRFDGEELIEQFKTIVPDRNPCGPHAPIDLLQLAAEHG